MSNYLQDLKKCKNEKEIQKIIGDYFTSHLNKRIIEEEFKDLGEAFKEHNFLLLSPYQNDFKGLRYHIEQLNSHIYSDEKLSHLSKEKITEILIKDFISKYDRSNHIDIYKLIFYPNSTVQDNKNKRIAILKDKNNKEIEFYYNVISYSDVNKNEFTFIKEKRIELRSSCQLPDFAIYINGIPLYAVEVKTTKAGLDKALSDYRTKESYKKFIGCIGTDGNMTFISFMPSSPTYYEWKAYGNNKNSLNETNFQDLCSDLLFNKEKSLFYLLYGVSVEKDITGELLLNQRCQQFYTLYKLNTIFNYCEMQNKRDIRKVIKHVQRSGKSITIKSMINLLVDKYPNLFKKIYICVPDTVISKGISTTFGELKLNTTGRQIKVIESRKEYDNSIEKNLNQTEVYLMNIQKIDLKKNKNKKYKKDDVLIVIDEVHTHQAGKSAEMRYKNFPNASVITFTATPRMLESKNNLINLTKKLYSDDNEYLDEFKAKDALELGIILPINYEKSKYVQNWDEEKTVLLDVEQQKMVEKYMSKSIELKKAIDAEIDEMSDKLLEELNKKIITEEVYYERLEKIEEDIKEKEKKKIKELITETNIRKIKENTLSQKIDFIVKDVKEKRISSFSDLKGNPYFKTKSFWVVEDVDMAKKAIKKIQELSKNDPLNRYQDIRFAVDYAENMKEGEDGNSNLYDANSEYKTRDQLNKKIVYGNTIIDDFESEKEDSVDVLIIVGKYLMGYDEKKLVTVYVDTSMNEASRLYQLITRPATARKNKSVGFVCDLTWSEKNYNTFKKALGFYDASEGNENEEFILSDDIIQKELNLIDQALVNIVKILKVNKISDINGVNKPKLYKTLISLKEEEQMKFFYHLAEINKSIAILIVPQYYVKTMDEIYILLEIVDDYYNNILNQTTKQIHYNPTLIKKIIEDTFKVLKIKDISDIINYRLDKTNLRILTEDTEKTDYSQELANLQLKMRSQRRYAGYTDKTLWQEMLERQEELKQSIIEDEKSRELFLKKLEELKNLNTQLDNETKKVVMEEFKCNPYHYFAYKEMWNALKEHSELKDYNEENLRKFIYNYTFKLSETFQINLRNNTELNALEIDEDILELLIKTKQKFYEYATDHESETEKLQSKNERSLFYKYLKTDSIKNVFKNIANKIKEELQFGDL